MISSLRFENQDLLLLDCGGVIPFRGTHRKMRADIIFKAMNEMSYDAMNLSGSDFSFGIQYLEKLSESLSFPLLSSNVAPSGAGALPSWIKPYAIVPSGKLRIAILGVMPENSFEEIPENKKPSDLKIVPPKEALDRLLPEIAVKADFVILLSQLDLAGTTSLVGQVKGIDLAISHEKRDAEPVPQHEGDTVLTPCGTKSSNIEIIELSISSDGKSSVVRNKPIALNDEVPHDEDIDKLIQHSYLEELRIMRDARFAEQNQELHKNLMDGLNLSPQEFFRQMEQNNQYQTAPSTAVDTGADATGPKSN